MTALDEGSFTYNQLGVMGKSKYTDMTVYLPE